jgi:hypothetical protein
LFNALYKKIPACRAANRDTTLKSYLLFLVVVYGVLHF